VGEKEKPKLNDYKSQEEFRMMVIGTGTPAEEREEERAK
jgi:hypothetical protein